MCTYNNVLPPFRGYHQPDPPLRALLDDISSFTRAISESLRAGCIRKNKIDVNFRSDSFKILFSNKGTGTQYNLTDFDQRYFLEGWNRYVCKTGEGFEVDFPIILVHKLKWTNHGYCRVDDRYERKKRTFSEVIAVTICKRTFKFS